MSGKDWVEEALRQGTLTAKQISDLARAFQLQNALVDDGKPGDKTLGRAADLLRYYDGRSSTDPPVAPANRIYLLGSSREPDLDLAPVNWVHGIDLDHHQRFRNNISESKLSAGDPLLVDDPDVRFAYVGLTEGTSGRSSIDPMFRHHILRLHHSGVPVGVYHFGRPSSAKRFGAPFGTPKGEAENFANYYEVAHKLAGGKLLPPVLDMEDELETLTPNELIDWTSSWCSHCELLTGRWPIIYTYFSFIHVELKGYDVDRSLLAYPLWVADYRAVPPNRPRDIPDWPWLFWQYTGAGRVRSITGDVDRNVFRGTEAQLARLCA